MTLEQLIDDLESGVQKQHNIERARQTYEQVVVLDSIEPEANTRKFEQTKKRIRGGVCKFQRPTESVDLSEKGKLADYSSTRNELEKRQALAIHLLERADKVNAHRIIENRIKQIEDHIRKFQLELDKNGLSTLGQERISNWQKEVARLRNRLNSLVAQDPDYALAVQKDRFLGYIDSVDAGEVVRTPTVEKTIENLLKKLQAGNVFVHGVFGTGKTSVAVEAAKLYSGKDPILLACSKSQNPEEWLTEYIAARDGLVLILDEMNTLTPENMIILNTILEAARSNTKIKIGDIEFVVDPRFRVIGTGNLAQDGIIGRYTQDNSTADRFAKLEVNFPPVGELYQIMVAKLANRKDIYDSEEQAKGEKPKAKKSELIISEKSMYQIRSFAELCEKIQKYYSSPKGVHKKKEAGKDIDLGQVVNINPFSMRSILTILEQYKINNFDGLNQIILDHIDSYILDKDTKKVINSIAKEVMNYDKANRSDAVTNIKFRSLMTEYFGYSLPNMLPRYIESKARGFDINLDRNNTSQKRTSAMPPHQQPLPIIPGKPLSNTGASSLADGPLPPPPPLSNQNSPISPRNFDDRRLIENERQQRAQAILENDRKEQARKQQVDFRRKNLANYRLDGVNLNDAFFDNGNGLKGKVFSGSSLKNANFERIDLSGANFVGCNLEGANFVGCILNDCNFIGAKINGTNFSRATINRANFENALGVASFEDATMNNNKGIQN
jgi:Pentapeptide repeats (9 copies)/AAA domain (dynein-related subfamily)